MQSELPWNVAGIPPEARDAARTAARREGLSVGEWLSKRILRSVEGSGEDRASKASWGREYYSQPEQEVAIGPQADSHSHPLGADISGHAESQQPHPDIERQVKALASRLDAAEQNQSENSRAMSSAAAQINSAAHEQAQAFDRLAANVADLASRLAKVEREAHGDAIENTVKELHEGLSRLAGQVAGAASHSASQIAAVAETVESLGAAVQTSQKDSTQFAQDLDRRIAALHERMGIVETTARASASALDGVLECIETLRAASEEKSAAAERDFARLAELLKQAEGLEHRIGAAETNSSAALARLDEMAATVGAKASAGQFAGRFQSIETVLSSIAARMEGIERSHRQGAELRKILWDLAAHLELADKRNRQAIAEIKATGAETMRKTAQLEKAIEATSSHVPFDVPPFAQAPESMRETGSAAPADPPSGFVESGGAFATALAPDLSKADYLAAGRRSARAVAFEQERTANRQNNLLIWAFRQARARRAQPAGGETRYPVAAAIVLAGVVAALAGTMLSRSLGLPAPNGHAASPRAETAATHSSAAQASGDDTLAADRRQSKGLQANRELNTPNSTAVGTPAAIAPIHLATPPRHAAQPATHAQALARLAAAGNSKAELTLGLKYLDGNGVTVNEAEAARWLARAARQGEAVAQYRLATMYERGRGVPADATQAAHWYELAAKQGNRKAMHDLAVAYADGSGKPKDYVQAVLWFGRAAALGLADSQFDLGVLYERGMGVKRSLVDAYKWYAIAAAQGDGEAKARLDAIGAQLRPADRAAAQDEAAAFKAEPIDPAANSAGSSSG